MRGGRTKRTWAARALAAASRAAIMAAATATAANAVTAPPAPCGTRAGPAPATYRHVIVIMDENESFSDVPTGRRRT